MTTVRGEAEETTCRGLSDRPQAAARTAPPHASTPPGRVRLHRRTAYAGVVLQDRRNEAVELERRFRKRYPKVPLSFLTSAVSPSNDPIPKGNGLYLPSASSGGTASWPILVAAWS